MKAWAGLRGAERLARAPAAADTAGYAVFISYSHAADGRLAPAVQRGLERLAKPWYRRRVLRVFRDDSGLAVTPALWSAIAAALDRSEYLVVLASPDAARSKWVGQEIEYWKASKSVELILPVITEGECRWDPVRGDFGADSTAVPPSLLSVFIEEPRWLDLRWARTETQLDLRHSGFRDAIAQLAAPIHGRPKDELESEDIRLHRRALRLARTGVATLLVLLVVASITGVVAVSNARRAEQQALTVQARELAARATATRDQQPLSLLLSLESLRRTLTDEARDTLLQGVLQPRHNVIELTDHTGAVDGVAFSPDSKTIVSANADGTVRRWDAATGQQLGQPLIGHTDQVLGVAFSPDGKTIVSASKDFTLRRWDAATGQPIGQPLSGHTNAVAGVAFSPDGKTIVSASQDFSLRRWDAATGQPIGQPLTGHRHPVKAVVFSPDGKMIVSGGDDGMVRRWDAVTGQELGQPSSGHDLRVLGVTVSPDGKMIASVGDDQTVRRWDAATGQPIDQPSTGHTSTVWAVAFSHDSATIASTSADRTVRLWDAATGEELALPLVGHTDEVVGAAFSPDGKMIASASNDQTVRLWDTTIGQPLGHDTDDTVTSNPDDATTTSADTAGAVRRWEYLTGGKSRRDLIGYTDDVFQLAFSPDGKMIAAASLDKTVWRWEAATGQPLGQPLPGHGRLYSVAFSADSKMIASGSWNSDGSGTVQLWDAATGNPIGQPLVGHTSAVVGVAFSPDGNMVASASWDGTMRRWDTTTGQQLGQPIADHDDVVRDVDFSPDGKMIVSVSDDRTVRLWDIATGNPIGQPLIGHTGWVQDVAFSPDGKTIASASDDRTVRLWDTATRTPLIGQPLTGHITTGTGIVFSLDGKAVTDGLWVWPITLRAWIQHACTLAKRNLRQEEWDQFLPDTPYVRTCPDLPSGYGVPSDAPPATYDHLD